MGDIEIFEASPGAWAVRGKGQYQPFDPELPGFQPMTRERAEEIAALLAAASEPPTE